MTYRIIIRIDVVNEDGDPVSHKGFAAVPGRSHVPLSATQEFSAHVGVADAHQRLNDLVRLVDAAKNLR
ncbi:hypothetical protein AWB81_06411 [Caballeronia arationis]|uniref:hypothetical protein n=1 Tax=Caballeronia arationis TaxID=1777142 RepID=UPI00074B81E6|nr:hypothetical protein [Caballeronia arationis]SAL03427.1 hypothetical protein AWB81_06411 [Caballeronia arationis]